MGNQETLAERVGAHILALRKQKGMTQAQLAEAVRSGQKEIYQWEKGLVEPRLSRLVAIAAALDTTAAAIIEEAEEVWAG